jgi:muramoyltetrapeptide carboxypeptidase
MNRRDFQKKLALGLPAFAISSSNSGQKPRLLPRRLKKGDTIGLITPGSYITDDGLAKAIENLTALGFKVKLGAHIRAEKGFTAGTDQQRLKDLHDMFADDSVQGIWCARGGYGCTRLLPHIDFKLIRKHPKVLIGYSDITALLNAIYEKSGLLGFHGPVGASTFTDYTTSHIRALTMETQERHMIRPASKNLEQEDVNYHPQIIRSGQAEGRLIGGNLSLLASMAGTDYLPDFKGRIVFIEEIGEKPYRVDRMLTQLRQACRLEEAAGIAMGIFADCEAKEGERSLSLQETVRQNTEGLGIPVIYGLSFGHISEQCTLPVGAMCKLDVAQHTLEITEPVVI